jgi:hypothetical protein
VLMLPGGCGCGGATPDPNAPSSTLGAPGNLPGGGGYAAYGTGDPTIQTLPPVLITASRDVFPWWLLLLVVLLVARHLEGG